MVNSIYIYSILNTKIIKITNKGEEKKKRKTVKGKIKVQRNCDIR